MSNQTPLYSLSISARLTLDMHSLNNEGGEGNQIQTRMVNILDQNGALQNVNAISGDMIKHMQSEYLFKLAQERKLPMSTGAATFNANRINADADFIARVKEMNDADALDDLLRTCAITDMQGVLVTEGGKSLPRKSVVEFGWVIGVPDMVETDSYFHVKYVNEGRSKTSESRDAESKSGANLGQSIFHRPASSGAYALVAHVNLARIGFNDITQQYAISEEERLLRGHAMLESVLYTFLQPTGAMRSTQAPHIVNVEGAVSISTSSTPAPTVSPLNDAYRQQIQAISESLRPISKDSVQVAMFDDSSQLTEVFNNLLQNYRPYMIQL